VTGVEGEASGVVSWMSLGRTSFDRREFLRPANTADRGPDHFAEAGVTGDLNTLLCESSDRGDGNGGVRGDSAIKDDSVVEGTLVDSPTHAAALSGTTRPSYSKPELPCTMGIPRPAVMGFHGSLNCGLSDGEPMLEEETDAPDSDEAERMGGCSKECEAEFGDPWGLYWKEGFTPCAMPS
jgi:hypothetical protein